VTLLEIALDHINEKLASGKLTPEQVVALEWQKQLLFEDVAAENRRKRQRIERDQVHEWEITRRQG